MGEVAPNSAYAGYVSQGARAPEMSSDFLGAMGAAFRQENDVVAATRYLMRPQFSMDTTFDVATALSASPYANNYTNELSRAQSQAEFDSIEARIKQEVADKQLIAGQTGGWAMMMGAGILSPTSAVPFMGPARGLKGAAQATALAFGATGAQELTLYATQEARTPEETMLGIAAGTVLGGLLGGTAAYLKKGEFNALASDMASSQSNRAISSPSAPHALSEPTPDIPVPALRDEVVVDATIPTTKGTLELSVVRNLDELAPRINNFADPVAKQFQLDELQVKMDAAVARGEVNTPAATRTTGEVTMNLGAEGQPEVYIKVSELEGLRATGVKPKPQAEVTSSVPPRSGEGLPVDESPVTLRVNDKGEAVVTSGAERIPAARTSGADQIKVKVEYMNGGNETKGRWQPVTLIQRLSQKTDDLRRLDETANAKELKLAMESDTFEMPSAKGVGAAAVDAATLRAIREGVRLEAPAGLVRRFIFNILAKLNPITRMIEQTTSPSLSAWAAKLSDAGLRTTDNAEGIAHAIGGTWESRQIAYEAPAAEALQNYDKAYAAYVMRGVKEGDVTKMQIWLSQSQAGLARATRGKLDFLPEGKMNLDEFDSLVFELSNTGRQVDDPTITAAVKLWPKFYGFFEKKIREAEAEVKLKFGADSPQLIPDSPNLGPGVKFYIRHQYDTAKIIADSGNFIKLLRNSAEVQYVKRFVGAQGKLHVRLAQVDEGRQFLSLTSEGRTELLTLLATQRKLMKTVKEKPAAIALVTSRIRRLKKVNKELGLKYNALPEGKRTLKDYATLVEREIKRVDEEGAALRNKFETRWRKRGAVGKDIIKGKADFKFRANEDATLVYNHITGNEQRIAGMDILAGERGPTLARVLNLPFEQKMQYLITNPEQLIRSYGRQMASDIELYRITGSVNGARMFAELNDDFATKRVFLETTKVDIKTPTKFNNDGSVRAAEVTQPMTQAIREKKLTALAKQQKKLNTDLEVTVRRMRHQRGISSNPEGFMYRLGRAAVGINVFRNMGMVTISSLADVGRPVMKAGIMDTFKYGYLPLISGLKELKMSRALVREMGNALDPIMQNRGRQVFDVLDNYASRQTFPERAIEFLANKTGFVAGFNRWTAEIKYISANVGMGVTGKYLRKVNTEVVGSKGFKEAQTFLAAHGIDRELSQRIWKQFDGEGSSEMANGTKLPNLESWTDAQAIDAYKATVGKWTNDTIVTPGLDRPNWVDANMAARMVAQFRSFTFTSTNRTVMAGMQDWNMQLLNGVNVSLGMGALSYYLWAVSTGGDAYDEMMKGDSGVWADQMINRSGLLGVFAEPWTALQRIPGMNQYVTFGGSTVRNYRGSSLVSAVAGPSLDLAEKMASVVMAAGYPTQSTAQTVRKVMAYQNVFWLRQLYEQVAQSSAEAIGLPEKRKRN